MRCFVKKKMVINKTDRAVCLFEKEAAIFEILSTHGPCNSIEVSERLGDPDLLQTMRLIHQLEARGLLMRTHIGRRKLFKVKPQMKAFKIFTRPKTLNDRVDQR